jgi:type IV pilus assembly protein PilW
MKTSTTQRGFTLVELMIAVVIGLFLVGGLLTLVQAMKRTSVSQSGLSQLQENERMAMTLITDVIQSSGYFILNSANINNTANSSFGVIAPFTVPGQYIYGTGAFGGAANTVSITVRYMTTGSDGVINCNGGTSAVQATFVNTFSIDTVNNNLRCQLTVNGGAPTTVALINGISNMQIRYGVQTNTSVSNNSIDTYLDATLVTDWTVVKSVKITLTFINPMYGNAPGQTTGGNTLATIDFTRIIPVMSNTGIAT